MLIPDCSFDNEPNISSYVGEGGLSAAISYKIHNPPAVDSIISTIEALSSNKGCMVILRNSENKNAFSEVVVAARNKLKISIKIILIENKSNSDIIKGCGVRGVLCAPIIYKNFAAVAKHGPYVNELTALYETFVELKL